ncbi:C40 family peptidase [Natronosporangium hydrolyticum]|uniref:C40 family peptidase n=1 Tax=Natronosporangium hydrolyticum TaxID=2811111 RepID=A0A895YMF2_9ACTN|nr:C40 family peptidase [Natronosporangium hydrolyticum]QSB15078.1 C40 family peptidase [Natronosporangium hydrolyticum]
MGTPARATRPLAHLALSTVLSLALVGTLAAPGHADRSQVPDGGEPPRAAGEVPMPDGGLATPITPDRLVDGPLAAEIAELELEIEALTLQLETISPELEPAQSAVEYAEIQLAEAVDTRDAAQEAVDTLVGESFRGAAALPTPQYLRKLPGLSAHAPLPVAAPLGVRTAARELVEAREAEQAAIELFAAAQDAEANLGDLFDDLATELSDLQLELDDLHQRNLAALAQQERQREASEQAGASDRFPDSQPVDGFEAHPDALRAVSFALGQLGKPYQWGAQGPDRFDCSGLVWAAYRHAGHSLPRVAADQYNGTSDRVVTRSAAAAQRGLLPGDLVFFSSAPNWQSIHHVGMYVGDGQMVHAPNRNEVVKVSPVWWSRFFGATRPVGAVPAEDPPSPTPPRPTPPRPTAPSPTGGPSPTLPPSTPPTSGPPSTSPPSTSPPTTSPPPTSPTPTTRPPTTTPPDTPPPTTTPPDTPPPTTPPPSPTPPPTTPPTTTSPTGTPNSTPTATAS